MSNDRNQTSFRAGASVAENDSRSALEQRDRGRASNDARAGGPTQLRRWSVAELIAGAVARPQAGGIAH